VYVRRDGDTAPGTLVGSVNTDADQGDWLTVPFAAVEGVRHVRVETLAADGWVILHEVRVLGS
jgi:hypothetical protein